uniref:hypothetical protein n=1 Tax=Paractinoplanes polyasparticus TaxID=2856853 RepID=UPI001C841D8A|nr:hypothetical protein [Actinoplanes polyasparticus]
MTADLSARYVPWIWCRAVLHRGWWLVTVPAVLLRAERAQLTGTVAGLAALGGLAWIIGRSPAMMPAGAAMLVLGLGIYPLWVNGQATAAVRATVHSLLAQVDYVGTIGCGPAVAVVADRAGFPGALAVCAALPVAAVVLVRRSASGWQGNRKRRR